MQAALAQESEGSSLALKVAIATGPVRRFLVGDPTFQHLEVLAGQTLGRMAAAEQQAQPGEVVLDKASARRLGAAMRVRAWHRACAVVEALTVAVPEAPWPPVALAQLPDAALRAWLSPTVYERLLLGSGAFLTELRPAVALFLHLGELDYDGDEQASARLDAYIRWVQQVVARYEGTLLDITMGDKGGYLYVAFGALLAHEDDPMRALWAAQELRRPPRELAYMGPARIGISRGIMRTGAYGSQVRRTYGVLGDEVNLAARLMQHAAPGEVVVSGRMQAAVGSDFSWCALPPVAVKGKGELIAAFRLEGVEQPAVSRLQEPRYTLPLVGRAAEQALIEEKLSLALRGKGQIVAITGEAGMGKSRLLAEATRLAQARGVAAHGGVCQTHRLGSAYLVWQPIWRGLFGLDPRASVEAQRRALAAALAEIDPRFLPRLPLLAAVCDLPIPENALTRSLDPTLRQASLEALLIDCLKARAAQGPLLLVLEDTHWLDPLSHDLLEAVGQAIESLPVLILLAHRPLELPRLREARASTLPYYTEITLGELDPEVAAQFIRAKLAQMGWESGETLTSLVELVQARSEGNLFYMEELLTYLHDQGVRLDDPAALRQTELPASLHSLILSRIDQLGEREQITLKVASVVGRLFQAPWLWGGYPALGSPEEVRDALELLDRLGLIQQERGEPELWYLFKHVLTQEVTYESLPYATRAMLHEAVARYLEAQNPDPSAAYLELLAYHYERSENVAKSRDYLRRAGEAAQMRYNRAAQSYYERLLPLLELPREQAEIHLALGDVLHQSGEWEAATPHYEAALRLAEHAALPDLAAQSHYALARLHRGQSRYEEALRDLEQAEMHWQKLGSSEAAQLGQSRTLTERGVVLWHTGEYAAARAALEASMTLASAVGAEHCVAEALRYRGIVLYFQGDYIAARASMEESLAICRARDDKQGISACLNNLGTIVERQGDHEAALVYLEESLALKREIGDKQGISTVLNNLGNAARSQGEHAQAQRYYEESLALCKEVGERYGISVCLNNLGVVAYEMGEYVQAQRYYEESLTLDQEVGDRAGVALTLVNLGLVAARLGRTRLARARYAEGLRLAREIGHQQTVLHGLVGLAGQVGARGASQAVVLCGAISHLAVEASIVLDPIYAESHARTLATVRALLEPPTFDRAWAEGQGLSLEQALALALAGRRKGRASTVVTEPE